MSLVLCFTFLLIKLFSLSYMKGEQLSEAAVKQQSSKLVAAQMRGTIYDRGLFKFTNNVTQRIALIIPGEVTDVIATAGRLAECCGGRPEQYAAQIAAGKPFTVKLLRDGGSIGGARFITVADRTKRTALAQHLIGYTDGDDKKGLCGIEKAFDQTLSECGGSVTCYTAKDAFGKQLMGVACQVSDSRKGDGVALTLDLKIQAAAENAAKAIDRGTVVVCETATGKLLASVSRPNYDPSYMSRYLNSSQGELLNRAFSSYDAGSVFKLVVLSAYLEKFGRLPEMKAFCGGKTKIGDLDFSCHKLQGHGILGIRDALAQSCNIYFYELAKITGYNDIIEQAERYGIGTQRVIANGLGAAKGSLPKKNKRPALAETANIAIGQGGVMLTALDAAYIVNAIANGGKAAQLSLIEGDVKNGRLVNQKQPEMKQVISKKTADTIKELMVYTVENGTGAPAKPAMRSAGGKTASAETGWKQNGQDVIHGWFAGFYPAENPRYTIVVIVENGRQGGASAGPIFKSIADDLYALETSPP